ncbi:MAG: hypothetical protein K2X50_01160 [Gammaproteobacteria bacterium]|nr:hypothetical protein [Gammaproteobacteria bacterium]
MSNKDKDNKDKLKEDLYQYVKDNYWMIFRRDTTILSSTCRQLALGLGSISIFGKSNPCYTYYSCYVVTILLLLLLFFIFDAAQYFYQSNAYRDLAKDYDHQIDNNKVTKKSQLIEREGMNDPTNFLFNTKLILLALASVFFLILLFKNI